jgi:hypothetical protein
VVLSSGQREGAPGGGCARFENSYRPHPWKSGLKLFLVMRGRCWRGSRVAYFWVTSFRKKLIGSRGVCRIHILALDEEEWGRKRWR